MRYSLFSIKLTLNSQVIRLAATAEDHSGKDVRFTLYMHTMGTQPAFIRHSQHGDTPVFACPLPSGLEARQANESHRGGDGQGADVLQQKSRQAQGADEHLNEGRHNDGALDLWGCGKGGAVRLQPLPTQTCRKRHNIFMLSIL